MLKEQLLEMLLRNEEEFISGEKISNELGCSRTAVWKQIEELRKAGYEVEAVSRKGYRLIRRPNAITPREINVGLDTAIIGQSFTYKESLTSTQEVAHKLVHEGVKEGHVVIADEQTNGKGRLGRQWYSPIGTSIYMSIILRPQIAPQQAPQLTLLAAVSVVRGIKQATGIDCDIKWPNDILLNGKKVVGILTEMQAEPDTIHSVIVGIGINVNQTLEQFPTPIRDIATSLAIEKEEEINRAHLIRNIFKEMEQLYRLYMVDGFAVIKPLWETYAISIGQKIKARTLHTELIGFAKGITDEGVLLLEDMDGCIHSIYSADIEIS